MWNLKYFNILESTSKEELLRQRSKKKLCKSLQEIVSQVKDPDSIFTDIDLVREYTGCKIPIKKKTRR